MKNDEGDIKRFRIVGYDEIFGRKDYISIDSPMARALLKKEVGDLAIVNTPAGEASWYVNGDRIRLNRQELSERRPARLVFFCRQSGITSPCFLTLKMN
ncbi:transcription elongation factor GreB [Klebsiella pneumoniae]|uniref:Transcription elongation factor GreB n=1 Tax=Klebsiella pneumoniae TaxID=573 RepID=A0A378FTP2_KLEPN|nr:transcription elongation factor GreB [Klebsiella pneumoniae]